MTEQSKPNIYVVGGDSPLSPIEDIIEDARQGRMYILVDAEERENEGDLIIPAQFATPDAVNFMAKFGRGLICLTMTAARAEKLGLEPMARDNRSRNRTAFTVSIEAKEGISTGISAADRARTIAVAVDPEKGADDIVSPGHVFPLVAKEGGVLWRGGHTEAAVDISRMAGLNPAAVICEIMNDDGTMARLPDLVGFAQRHGLKIGAISDLIAYRRRHDHVVERVAEREIDSVHGGRFKLIVYRSTIDGSEHAALVRGEISPDRSVLARVHKADIANDLLGLEGGREGLVPAAMRAIAAEPDGGVLVLIRETGGDYLSRRFGAEAPEGEEPDLQQVREIGIGSQILRDLGVEKMTLLTNTRLKLVGLDGFGLTITGTRRLDGNDD